MKITQSISLQKKIFISSVIICFIALSLMATINYYQTNKRIKRYHESTFNKKEQIVLKSFQYFIDDSTNIDKRKITLKLRELAQVNGLVLEFYEKNNKFTINSTGSDEYKKNNSFLFKQLELKNKVLINSNEDKNRSYSYNNVLINSKKIGVLGIIYYKNNHLLNSEIKQLIKQYVFLMLFLIFLSAVLAWLISDSLIKKIKTISEKLNNTDIINSTNFLKYPNKDEITPLVISYNTMLEKIQQQKEIISQAEREETWKDMAKQVAHEINNPLTPMRLTIQDFNNKFKSDEVEVNKQKVNDLSNMLLQQIDLIATISSSFTNFTKMPEKKDEYLEIISITKSLLFIYNDFNIEFNYSPYSIYMKFDKLFYIRILTNLIKNAIQASENIDNPKIIINIADKNDIIFISVQDFGKSIPVHIQDKIFNKNFTTKKTGLGIGLSMVKEIIESYNGKIFFESQEAKGTTFFIEISNNL